MHISIPTFKEATVKNLRFFIPLAMLSLFLLGACSKEKDYTEEEYQFYQENLVGEWVNIDGGYSSKIEFTKNLRLKILSDYSSSKRWRINDINIRTTEAQPEGYSITFREKNNSDLAYNNGETFRLNYNLDTLFTLIEIVNTDIAYQDSPAGRQFSQRYVKR